MRLVLYGSLLGSVALTRRSGDPSLPTRGTQAALHPCRTIAALGATLHRTAQNSQRSVQRVPRNAERHRS
jgi:hypothetical protein